jgi:hypothetical protein
MSVGKEKAVEEAAKAFWSFFTPTSPSSGFFDDLSFRLVLSSMSSSSDPDRRLVGRTVLTSLDRAFHYRSSLPNAFDREAFFLDASKALGVDKSLFDRKAVKTKTAKTKTAKAKMVKTKTSGRDGSDGRSYGRGRYDEGL